MVGQSCQEQQKKALDAAKVPGVFVGGTVNTQGCSGHDACYAATKAGAANQIATLGNLDMLMLDYPACTPPLFGVSVFSLVLFLFI